jgi:hypothetical protein
MPLPAACRCDTASIQRSRDFPQGRSPGLLCLSDDGQHVGSEPADSDDLARVYRFDLAQDSEMISPTIPI